MRKVILYIAQSLDGKIARQNGDVDWLDKIHNPEDEDYGYPAFYASIDTTLMGSRTYEKILSFGIEFPYAEKENYVFSLQKGKQDTEYAKFIGDDVAAFVREIKQEEGRNIWLVGGSEINTVLFNAGLIDEIHLFTMPITLGEGIPLFAGRVNETQLKLAEVSTYTSGVICKKYVFRKD
ncbi:dihydrofolate reductase family protein [Mangrovibacterium lignilyticum]|uniref:dihydrofolate reductase family protein n=1 Tax=Mangrovibacterium lignilyticum TaxID=2668052 RepID=UPI0013D19DC7|nr:dihydrofolate reductase family protein [Mangrovibacterium lignilyticum]